MCVGWSNHCRLKIESECDFCASGVRRGLRSPMERVWVRTYLLSRDDRSLRRRCGHGRRYPLLRYQRVPQDWRSLRVVQRAHVFPLRPPCYTCIRVAHFLPGGTQNIFMITSVAISTPFFPCGRSHDQLREKHAGFQVRTQKREWTIVIGVRTSWSGLQSV
jgi:hypothetical protein